MRWGGEEERNSKLAVDLLHRNRDVMLAVLDHKPQSSNKTLPTKSYDVIYLLDFSSLFSRAVFSDDASFLKLPVPGNRSGPEAFAIDSTGKGFYTGVSGGKILSYTPGKGYIEFAYMTESSDVLKAVASKDATGKLFKYDPSKKVVTVLLEGLSGSAGCAVSSDGSFVLVGQFTKSNIKRYWIKGPKAGSSEDFTNAVSNPDNIKRIGSTGNFWVASVVNTATGITNPSAVKVNSDGKVLQTISVKDKFGDTLVSEVNESQGKLYIGTLFGPFAGILKL
ncbi:hypothetical protein Bca101_056950 [Brassica carinata]